MRAFEGQRSDNQPVKRSRAEKEKLLRELRDTLADMKSDASASLRQSIQKRTWFKISPLRVTWAYRNRRLPRPVVSSIVL